MVHISSSHDCHEELRSVSLKVTPARLGVLEALEETSVPLDALGIGEYLQKNGVTADRVTIFRIMNSLTQKGLVVPIQLNEGKVRYEHISKADHHHFICEICGAIEDVSDCNIGIVENNIAKKGLLVKRHSLEFFGLCKNCQSAQ